MLDNNYRVENISKEKLNTIHTLLGKFINGADSYAYYAKVPRTYGTDDLLYMRETHFIQVAARLENPEIGEIAKQLKVTPGAASQTATKLESKGLLTRRKSPADSRVVICELTEKAKTINEFHEQKDNREFLKLADELSDFDDDDIEKIFEFLDIISVFFKNGIEKYK